ncbi:uroporphyrinogen-III C-methyltransferase [Hansschlegelia plantiphila]|uniref:uroporphyrinogen-III C-methyltransferase n=1 Tax=Hansschlegelia plantiphila TaxID=374655 RepID=A0A9W6J1G5_9HYPH|nr:uroporphyrinogen-III C-methyltransferase [Hansschlegelia plantiphila]GLK67520.1 uroporphyrin-III C-methyltransferase [Hansschlegelia plantiphila]
MPPFPAGCVWLVGAGPGDLGLLTLQAAWALAQADIIFFDALVNEDVLRLAGGGAEFVFVGKRAGCPSPKQSDITALLVSAARKGKRVLRLKGGDPYVFGRGAEEAQGLVAAGTPFRVAPGVTAGIGGLAAAGIPVTHRDVNQSVTFVTAHDASGGLSQKLNWAALAAGSPVLVIYMGVRLMREIGASLLAAGRAPDESVAVVSHATTPRQTVLRTTLERLAAGDAPGAEAPALIVIGRVVDLAPVLAPIAPALVEA